MKNERESVNDEREMRFISSEERRRKGLPKFQTEPYVNRKNPFKLEVRGYIMNLSQAVVYAKFRGNREHGNEHRMHLANVGKESYSKDPQWKHVMEDERKVKNVLTEDAAISQKWRYARASQNHSVKVDAMEKLRD